MITLLHISGIAPGGLVGLLHGGLGPFRPALPMIAELSAQQWLIYLGGAVSLALNGVTLYMLVSGKAQNTRITPQPLEVVGGDPFVKQSIFSQRCSDIERGSIARREQSQREHTLAMESVERVETQLSEMRSENEERAVKLHDRVNVLVETNGEITGEIKHLTIAVNNATKAAQDAAVAAARAGGRR